MRTTTTLHLPSSFTASCHFAVLLLLLSTGPLFSWAQVQIIPINDSIGLEMVYVKGGTFVMGSDEGNRDNRPAHAVTLRDFHIGRFELMQEQWVALMGQNPSQYPCSRCPVNDMSWDELQTFLGKLSAHTGRTFRLPTEAEWEYAAQGGQLAQGHRYSGSDNLMEVGWLKENGSDHQHETGLLKPNELGLYDMNGNVWELCQDWYDPKFYARSQAENPVNTTPAKYRVSRGASWMSPNKYCYRWARNTDHPHHKRGNGGFRVVMEK